MCEINPRRKKFFTLEFFTSAILSDAEWDRLLIEKLLALEESFNLGTIRVHIHENVDEGEQ